RRVLWSLLPLTGGNRGNLPAVPSKFGSLSSSPARHLHRTAHPVESRPVRAVLDRTDTDLHHLLVQRYPASPQPQSGHTFPVDVEQFLHTSSCSRSASTTTSGLLLQRSAPDHHGHLHLPDTGAPGYVVLL